MYTVPSFFRSPKDIDVFYTVKASYNNVLVYCKYEYQLSN